MVINKNLLVKIRINNLLRPRWLFSLSFLREQLTKQKFVESLKVQQIFVSLKSTTAFLWGCS